MLQFSKLFARSQLCSLNNIIVSLKDRDVCDELVESILVRRGQFMLHRSKTIIIALLSQTNFGKKNLVQVDFVSKTS